jgi:hypothetical protein
VSIRQISGAVLLLAVVAFLFGSMALQSGFPAALIAWGAAIGITAIVFIAVRLLVE